MKEWSAYNTEESAGGLVSVDLLWDQPTINDKKTQRVNIFFKVKKKKLKSKFEE